MGSYKLYVFSDDPGWLYTAFSSYDNAAEVAENLLYDSLIVNPRGEVVWK